MSTVIGLSTSPSMLIVQGRIFNSCASDAIDFCDPNS
jgi:hypothetical protein